MGSIPKPEKSCSFVENQIYIQTRLQVQHALMFTNLLHYKFLIS